MSYGFRTRVRRTQYLWDTLSQDEKENVLDWCGISDELIRENVPGVDIDEAIDDMGDDEFKSLFNEVIRRHRKRKKNRLEAEQNGVIEYENDDEAEEIDNDQAEYIAAQREGGY